MNREKDSNQEIIIEILLFIILSLRKMKKIDSYKLLVKFTFFLLFCLKITLN